MDKSGRLGGWGTRGRSGTLTIAAGASALLVVCTGVFLVAAQAPQPPTFRAGVNAVSVDVIVTDKTGALVTNLTPADFEITEQGKPQKIETFKLVLLDGGLMPGPDGAPHAITSDEIEAREAARDDVRLFGIFLDDYHVTRDASLMSRDRIARFIETDLGPSDMVGLMYPLTSLSSILMTRNHDAIQKGIEQFRGRKGEYDPPFQSPAEETAWKACQLQPACIEQIRDQVSFSALEGLITHLGDFKESRKTLILVTEGFGGILRGDSSERNLQDLYTLANRNNVSVYWIDPRMLSALAGRGSLRGITQQQDPLRALALYTGGETIITNDLTIAMKQIVRDSSGYYLLSYNSSFTGADGKFHDINVRVKRPGVEVRARKGYWALSQQQVMSAMAPRAPGAPKEVEHAIADAAAVSHARPIRTWVGVERGDNAKAKVTFVWEPSAQTSGAAAAPRLTSSTSFTSSTGPARVVLTALGSDGNQYFRGNVEHAISFDAAPGTIALRISVEAADASVLDTETREVPVPDVTSAAIWLSTPQVFRARTVREAQQIKADAMAVPLAGRTFGREERLLVRVAAYGPGTPNVTARLLNHLGQAVADVPVASAPSGPSREIDLTLANLTPGDYLVELDAVGAGNPDDVVKELVAFQVN